jgi:hypothetical protein
VGGAYPFSNLRGGENFYSYILIQYLKFCIFNMNGQFNDLPRFWWKEHVLASHLLTLYQKSTL